MNVYELSSSRNACATWGWKCRGTICHSSVNAPWENKDEADILTLNVLGKTTLLHSDRHRDDNDWDQRCLNKDV